jgi:hypothetical protein
MRDHWADLHLQSVQRLGSQIATAMLSDGQFSDTVTADL